MVDIYRSPDSELDSSVSGKANNHCPECGEVYTVKGIVMKARPLGYRYFCNSCDNELLFPARHSMIMLFDVFLLAIILIALLAAFYFVLAFSFYIAFCCFIFFLFTNFLASRIHRFLLLKTAFRSVNTRE